MSSPYARAPQLGERHYMTEVAPQAALLIDFDNVTLGRGSDLTKELRTLLNSEIIKGKVAVQRAYADWRRYPQYIVPLSEASIDLIFAPAYGSSKKNATDIRMAIDAVELVFVRPEIGTFILLTGDSDFSSVVLKLKEYGKYVIGVGIEESSSDILVQNCDEYYSYTSLTGLTKTSEAERVQFDPWVLVEEAVNKMTERRDVMRSDRLKQVMREIDKGFNEAEHGFPKFSKFLAEASSRGLVKLRKMENGQYEVSAGRKKRGRTRKAAAPAVRAPIQQPKSGDPIEHAYALLRMAMNELAKDDRDAARDSDVKRRMLILEANFDEAELGFPKFSLFLKQAEEHGVISLRRKEPEGYTEVRLQDQEDSDTPPSAPTASAATAAPAVRSTGRRTRPRRRTEEAPPASTPVEAPVEESAESDEVSEPASRGRERGRGDRGRGRGRRSRQEESAETESTEAVSAGHANSEAEDMPVEAEAAPEADPPQRSEESDTSGGGRREAIQRLAAAEREASQGSESSQEAAASQEDEASPVNEALAKRPVVTPAPTREYPVVPTTSAEPAATSRTLHPRQQSRRRGPDGPPPILEGQGVVVGSAGSGRNDTSAKPVQSSGPYQGLPTDPGAIERYLTHRYKGVGEKTAEQVVEAFGADVFTIMDTEPERVSSVLSDHRAEALLDAWKADKARRSETNTGGATS